MFSDVSRNLPEFLTERSLAGYPEGDRRTAFRQEHHRTRRRVGVH